MPSIARKAPPVLRGAANPRWRGGVWINSKGYAMLLVGQDHPMATCRAYAPRCRVVLYEHVGPPEPGQHAHHVDGDKLNDDPGNLRWEWPTEHGRIHLSHERARKLGRTGGRKAARNAKARARALDARRASKRWLDGHERAARRA